MLSRFFGWLRIYSYAFSSSDGLMKQKFPQMNKHFSYLDESENESLFWISIQNLSFFYFWKKYKTSATRFVCVWGGGGGVSELETQD